MESKVKVLHRCGGPDGKTFLRSVIAVEEKRSRWRKRFMKYWINVVDLDPPSVNRLAASWNITFVRLALVMALVTETVLLSRNATRWHGPKRD